MTRGARPRPLGAALSLLLALTAVIASTAPAAALDDVTGDLSDPEVIAFQVSPTSVDVSDTSATVKVTARVTDSGTGVEWVALSSMSPNISDTSFGAQIDLVSGDRFDGVYQGTVVIPKGGAPGDWPLTISARDRVNNDRSYQAEDLVAAGWPGYIAVTCRNPDLAPPSVADVQLLQPTVDVRGGPATSTVRVRLTDAGSGARSAHVSPKGPYADAGIGGIDAATLQLVSGTAADGWWQGTLRVRQYAHAGEWTLAVGATDNISNSGRTTADELKQRGLPATITVVSQEDVAPPTFDAARLSALALDVSQSDQRLSLDLTVSDDLSGVHDYDWGDSQVTFSLQHLGNGQFAQSATSRRLSGDDLHGTYQPSLTIPRSSATGPWFLRAFAKDKIGNLGELSLERMAELGLPPSVLVFNTPLPPLDLDVQPADGAAVVDWVAPVDDRGAEIVEYIVTESPQGEVVRTSADELSAVVPNLTNDVEHTFVVQAVNRAGASEPSLSAMTVPRATSTSPAPTPTPTPTGSTSTPTPTPAPTDASPTPTAAPTSEQTQPATDEESASPAPSPSTAAPAVMPPPARNDGVTRLAGPDRYTTAVAISAASFPSTANDVFIVTGTNWPDALAAGPAAASVAAPVLPVQPDNVPAAVLDELQRLQPRRAWVIGGAGAVSDRVLQRLRAAGTTVTRISGADRYATAAAVAARFFPQAAGAYYASGGTYADALGGGAAAAHRGWPLLLTQTSSLPVATPLIGRERIVLGGPLAISEAVRARLGARRISGADRFGTAAAVARDAWALTDVAYLATGTNFPDALAGAAAAARDGAPLLLAHSTCVTASTRQAFDTLRPRSRMVLGGAGVVSDRAAALTLC